jgi:carbamate kinase
MKNLAVVAFGGNALLRSGQKGTIDEQEANIYETCTDLLNLIRNDIDIVIGHGNGPQVGNVMLQHEAGEKLYGIPKQPVDVCVAETQGSIGYMIEQQLRNVLLKEKLERDILTLVTQVVVAKDDPAFKNPTKPVGPYYKKDEADKLTETNKWVFHEDPRGRGWRRVVPSPKPHQINNTFSIEKMARDGSIVVTVGGGGIPAFYVEKDKLQGIDAVIDKDLASAKLATEIHAEEFYILTDVSKVCINFNTPQEQQLDVLTVSDAKKYLENKEFAEGSMAPKIRAAIQFIEEGGEKCVITESSQLGKPEAGTQLIADK